MFQSIIDGLEQLNDKCDAVTQAYSPIREDLLNNPENVDRAQLDELFVKVNDAEWIYVQVEDKMEELDEKIENYNRYPGFDSYVDMSDFRGFFWKMLAIGYRNILVDEEGQWALLKQ